MPGPKLQFAFQGGGAKFLCMLPVAHAIRDLVIDNEIGLSALAGTSAGSICAALIAAECDFKKLLKYLRDHGDVHIEKLKAGMPDIDKFKTFASDVKTGLDEFNAFKISSYTKLNNWRNEFKEYTPFMSNVFLNGEPALLASELEEFISKIFEVSCDKLNSDPKFRSIEAHQNPRLFVTVSDVIEGDGKLAEGDLLRAVVDSCSIPIALRSFRYLNRSFYVDGGLCNNLPANYLLTDPSVPAFLVFPSEKEGVARPNIDNFFSYFMNVMSCPIEYNVKRARELVDEAFHIKLETDFSTFDFERGMAFVKDVEAYNNIYDRTRMRLLDFKRIYGDIFTRSQIRVTDTTIARDYISSLEKITENYEDFIDLKTCTLFVEVNETKPDRQEYRIADTVTSTTEFVVIKEKFVYYRSTLKTDTEKKTIPSIWYAHNITRNKELPIRVLSLGDHKAGNYKGCLVEFIDASKNIDVNDHIRITNVTSRKNDMRGMNQGSSEFMAVTNPHSKAFEKAVLICKYPRAIGEFTQVFAHKDSTVDGADVTDLQFPSDPHDYRTGKIGKSALNLTKDGVFYVDIVPISRPAT
jgi:predicted acylesterase/phospholipase RssA